MFRSVVMSAHSSHIEPPSLERLHFSELTSFDVNMTWCIFLGAILTNKPILKGFEIRWQRYLRGSLVSNLTQATGHELKSRPWANFNLRHGSSALDLVKHLWVWNSKLPKDGGLAQVCFKTESFNGKSQGGGTGPVISNCKSITQSINVMELL